MLDKLIAWSLNNRLVVLALAALILGWGSFAASRMPVDVFPDLTAPTVTVVAEAHGLAPEEVESLITFPIETAMNGATGVRRVRSSTATGIALIWVEFAWGTDIFRARQLVTEKLQIAQAALPPDLPPPVLAPVSSIMGEIMFLGLVGDAGTSPLDVRSAADWVVRRRLLALPGVSQVVAIGGGVKQIQVVVDPARLQARAVGLGEVVDALRESNRNVSGGFYVGTGQEYLIRGLGRVQDAADVGAAVVAVHDGGPVRVRDVADVVVGPALKRGEGSIRGRPAVVLAIQKQPDANTLELTRRLDRALGDIQTSLPRGIAIDRKNFRQADFISLAVSNVEEALRDGAILVVVILLVFLLNVRATVITLVAIPLSLLVAVLVLQALGGNLNTMTLGGLTIAIGALVDDAIITVENVFRRLREWRGRPAADRPPALAIVEGATREVRGSIFFATLIIMLVFLPLFFLSGVEGRLLVPMGLSYLVAIFASLVVALTVTPVLCYFLLGNPRLRLPANDTPVARWLKAIYQPALRLTLRWPVPVIAASLVGLAGALALVPGMGRAFLPEFNEGALTVSAVTLPGTSLERSDDLGRRLEGILLSFPEVVSTSRRTGRAELDEHAQGVEVGEIEVVFKLGRRSKEEFLADVRTAVSVLPMNVTFGGPLAHRIDHMLSGTRSNVAIKIFGDDLAELRKLGKQVEGVMRAIPGVVDLVVEQQALIPQLAIRYDHDALARVGLTTGRIGQTIDVAFQGEVVSKVLEGQRTVDLLVRYPESARSDPAAIGRTLVPVGTGGMVPLESLASISMERGPNTISREDVQRKLVVSCNVAGRDLAGAVAAIRAAVAAQVDLPAGYFITYGGQIESAEASTRLLGWLTLAVVAAILVLLIVAFGSWRAALIVMANLPLALIGGVFAVALTGGILSVASLVGFITLFGIATRNGIMMISHYNHLMRVEDLPFEEAIVKGSLERLIPILMTALTAGLALVPLVLRAGEPGNEIQAPMAVVIVGGLLSSTILNMVVIPALYLKFGRPAARPGAGARAPGDAAVEAPVLG
ncbi:MAG: efflux RND transporter permease subunit [Candidatus Sericytochromatia bacterium]|nr:efflux RND transporter permease subunit [Candidatus Tanganyikabacteria bacterium]